VFRKWLNSENITNRAGERKYILKEKECDRGKRREKQRNTGKVKWEEQINFISTWNDLSLLFPILQGCSTTNHVPY
jgi:hypothetical protein